MTNMELAKQSLNFDWIKRSDAQELLNHFKDQEGLSKELAELIEKWQDSEKVPNYLVQRLLKLKEGEKILASAANEQFEALRKTENSYASQFHAFQSLAIETLDHNWIEVEKVKELFERAKEREEFTDDHLQIIDNWQNANRMPSNHVQKLLELFK